jgi:hypothetical protein
MNPSRLSKYEYVTFKSKNLGSRRRVYPKSTVETTKDRNSIMYCIKIREALLTLSVLTNVALLVRGFFL